MADPVLTKADFVRRYRKGEFGNASPTWESYDDWRRAVGQESHPGRLFHIRNRIEGGETWYNVAPGVMRERWDHASRLAGEDNLYISEMCPHQHNLLQGEVQRGLWGIDLTYSMAADLPMREALARESTYSNGVRALLVLRSSLCPRSLEWMDYLLEEYPDHVIEFTALSVEWGTVSGYNTIFWEVRRY